jgi:hypothetical protein
MADRTQKEKDEAMSGNILTNMFKNPNREKVKKVIKKRQKKDKKKKSTQVSKSLKIG